MTPRARRGEGRGLLPMLAAALLLTLAVEGQGAITWTSSGVLSTGVVDSPVQFEEGAAAANPRYFKDFELSDNRTSFSGILKPKNGADATVKDVVRMKNLDDASRSVTLQATQVDNANVETFWWVVRDGSTTKAVFDYRAASPSATFTLPAGSTYTFDLRIDLADGSGSDNAGLSFGLQVVMR